MAEEIEGVVSNLLWGGLLLALSSRGDHAGLQQDTFKHDIVLGKVEENFSPHLLGDFKGPVNVVFTIK